MIPSASRHQPKGEPEPDPELRDNENVPLPRCRSMWEEDPAERLASSSTERDR